MRAFARRAHERLRGVIACSPKKRKRKKGGKQSGRCKRVGACPPPTRLVLRSITLDRKLSGEKKKKRREKTLISYISRKKHNGASDASIANGQPSYRSGVHPSSYSGGEEGERERGRPTSRTVKRTEAAVQAGEVIAAMFRAPSSEVAFAESPLEEKKKKN